MMPAVQYPVIRTTVAGIEHFLKLRPAHVQCDGCKTMYRCRNHSWFSDRTQVTADLKEAGWLTIGDHEQHICPECRWPE